MIYAVTSFRFVPEAQDAGPRLLSHYLEKTRQYDGCAQLTVIQDSIDPLTYHLIASWESQDHLASYHAFRADTGAVPDLETMLTGDVREITGVIRSDL